MNAGIEAPVIAVMMIGTSQSAENARPCSNDQPGAVLCRTAADTYSIHAGHATLNAQPVCRPVASVFHD